MDMHDRLLIELKRLLESSLGKVEKCKSSHGGEFCILPKGHEGPHAKHYFWTNYDPDSCKPQDTSKKIIEYLAERGHLEKLSNKELVSICAKTQSADSLIVLEMMRRLDPHWAD